MTKWARMRKRKERRRAEQEPSNSVSEGNETKQSEPEKVSDEIKHYEEVQKLETPKTSNLKPILSQIPKYVYLAAIFVLLSGVFFPLITSSTLGDTTHVAEAAAKYVFAGAASLFVGLAGGILIFKGTTNRPIFLVIGFALLGISMALIFQIQAWWNYELLGQEGRS